MKTTLSIANDLFDGAERLARRTHRSRSRLFTDALREYLARHAPDKVTESMGPGNNGNRRGKGRVCFRRGSPSARAHRVVISQGEVWWADLPAPSTTKNVSAFQNGLVARERGTNDGDFDFISLSIC